MAIKFIIFWIDNSCHPLLLYIVYVFISYIDDVS